VPWYQSDGPAEFVPVPVLGPDLVDLRQVDVIREEAMKAEEMVTEDTGVTGEESENQRA
jgi:hypothetical protein